MFNKVRKHHDDIKATIPWIRWGKLNQICCFYILYNVYFYRDSIVA